MIMESEARARARTADGRSLGALVGELSSDTATLVRHEIALARAELSAAVRRTAKDSTGIGIGVALAAVGGVVLTAALVAGLGDLLDNYWVAALIVAVLYLAVGGIGAMSALKKLRQVRLAPEQTLESLQVTQRWAREEVADLRAAITGAGDGRAGGPGLNRIAAAHAVHAGAARPVRRVEAVESPRDGSSRGAANGSAGRQKSAEPKQKGAMGLAKRTFHEIGDDDITGQAAKMAYYAFMAMPPALMALFALAGLFGSDRFAIWIEQQAAVALPAPVVDSIIRPFIEDVVLNNAPGPLSVGLLLALWGASAVFAGLMDTLNVAYDVEEDRSFVKKRGIALGVMLVGTLLFLLAAVALLAGPAIAKAVGLFGAAELIWNLVRWPLTFAFIVAAFWLGYYVLPNRDQSACKRTLLKAAAIAALLWLGATALFRVYIANFSSYTETYGFLGAFIILLLWLYVTAFVVLAGGELASEMEEGY